MYSWPTVTFLRTFLLGLVSLVTQLLSYLHIYLNKFIYLTSHFRSELIKYSISKLYLAIPSLLCHTLHSTFPLILSVMAAPFSDPSSTLANQDLDDRSPYLTGAGVLSLPLTSIRLQGPTELLSNEYGSHSLRR